MELPVGRAISVATAEQKVLEALALKLSMIPAVVEAKEAGRQVFLAHSNAKTVDGAASLEDAARQHFYGALQLVPNLDPYHPKIQSLFLYRHTTDGQEYPSALHGGIENPDNIYRIIPVSPDSRYELHGVRHNPPPAQVTFELMDSVPGLDSIGEQVAILQDRDMVIAPDGSYTITIDPSPADGRPNHIRTTQAAKCLFIRDSMSDWRTQRPDMLRIVRTAGPQRPPRTEQELINLAVWLIPHYAQFWQDLRDHYVAHMNLKTNVFDPAFMRAGGWQFISNTHFAIGDEEAFVFTTNPNDAPYHAVLIANHWWITMDSDRCTGSFNTSQATPNRDGSITFVVAARDPGAHNWLDTGGARRGILQVRWQGLPPDVTALPDGVRDFRVVKLAELKSALPPEAVWLTPDQRKAQREARHAAYVLRFSPQ
ncbi:MAG: DUF1214 domain-containing protein [Rhizomicrobium sp.]